MTLGKALLPCSVPQLQNGDTGSGKFSTPFLLRPSRRIRSCSPMAFHSRLWLPQLENWSLALGRAQAFLVDRYLPYLTWLARAPAGRPECTNCQKIRAQVAQAADSCCTLSQAFHCSDLGDDLTTDPQTINRAAVTK